MSKERHLYQLDRRLLRFPHWVFKATPLTLLMWYAGLWVMNSAVSEIMLGYYSWPFNISFGVDESSGESVWSAQLLPVQLLMCFGLTIFCCYLTLEYRWINKYTGKTGRGLRQMTWWGAIAGLVLSILVYVQINMFSALSLKYWPMILGADGILSIALVHWLGGRFSNRLRLVLVSVLSAKMMLAAVTLLLWASMGMTEWEAGLGALGLITLVIARLTRRQDLWSYIPGIMIALLAWMDNPAAWVSIGLMVGLCMPMKSRKAPVSLGEKSLSNLRVCIYLLIGPIMAFLGAGVSFEPGMLLWLNPSFMTAVLIGFGVWPVGYALGVGVWWLWRGSEFYARQTGQEASAYQKLNLGHIYVIAWLSIGGFAISPGMGLVIIDEMIFDSGWRVGISAAMLLTHLLAALMLFVLCMRKKPEFKELDIKDPEFDPWLLRRKSIISRKKSEFR